MPLTHLISPDDGGLTPIEDARLGSLDPWFPRAYILEIIEGVRDYQGGLPHVTGLINGPRLEWLKGREDYAESPDDHAWAIVGSAGHYLLEKYGGARAETPLANDYMQGRPDITAEGEGVGIEDYKVWGSYKIAKSLGIYWVSEPSLGPDGEPQVFGPKAKKAGLVKTHRVLRHDGKPDLFDLRAQLNGYRILWEEAADGVNGATVQWLRAFLIAREGGTAAARNLDLKRKTYRVEIEVVRDGSVEKWFAQRSEELQTAWDADTPPRACDDREAWSGRRCRGYCPVAEQCRVIGNPWGVT